MKKLIITLFALGSFSATAGCLKSYKDFIVSGGIEAASTMILPPLGIYNSYVVHQARKMRDLIKEAKQSRVGKRTKGLMKSLNGLKTSRYIHKTVLTGNSKKQFCQWVKDPRSRLGQSLHVTLYRQFKDAERLKIDMGRNAKGLQLIWTDKEDLRQ